MAKKALGKRRGPAGASPLDGPASVSGKENRAPGAAPDSSSTGTAQQPEADAAPQVKRSRKSVPAPAVAAVPVPALPLDRVETYDGTKAGGGLPTAWRDRGDGISSNCSASVSATTAQGDGQGRKPALSSGTPLPSVHKYVEQAVSKAVADSNKTLSSMLLPCAPGHHAKMACRTLKGPVLLPALIQSTAPTPPARWGHACAMLDAHRMLVYGGMDGEQRVLTDLWVLDVRTGQWSQMAGTAPPRAWHSVTKMPDRRWAVAYGEVFPSSSSSSSSKATGGSGGSSGAVGVREGAATSAEVKCEEISVLETDVGCMYEPEVKGRLPTRRAGHVAVFVPHATMPAGSSASIRPAEPTLVLFGGRRAGTGSSSARTTWHNDVYAWPVGTMQSGPKSTWSKIVETEGRQPLPRCYHCAVAVGGSRMVVFGGNNGEDTFADVAFLDCKPTVTRPDAWSWHWPILIGGGPRPRAGCTAIALGDRFVLFLGGWDVDEEETQEKLVKAQAAYARALAKSQAGLAPVNVASAPPYEAVSGREVGEAYGEAWLLDMRGGSDVHGEEWEWIRVEPTVQALASSSGTSSDAAKDAATSYARYLRAHLARAGHSAVLVEDVRGLLGMTLLQASSKGGLGMDSSGQSTLLLPPSAEIQGAIPGIVLFGGAKPCLSAEDASVSAMRQVNDVVVLALPPALVKAGDAARAAHERALLEYEELSAAEPVVKDGQARLKEEGEDNKAESVQQPSSVYAPFSPQLGSLPVAAGVGISPPHGHALAFPSLSQVPLGQADPDPQLGIGMGGEEDWDMVMLDK